MLADNTTIEKKEEPTPVISAPLASPSLIEEARAERIKIEAALKESKEILSRNEEAVAKLILGGRADAGKPAEIPKQDTPEEYAQKVMRGEVNPLL